MRLLILLSACFSLGLSYPEVFYGTTYSIKMPSWLHKIEFMPHLSSERTVLWENGKTEASDNARRRQEGNYFVIHNVTQKDDGKYYLMTTYGTALSTKSIQVKEYSENVLSFTGTEFNLTFNLEPRSCNIYFVHKFGHEIHIVDQGSLWSSSDERGCTDWQLLKPCGIFNEAVQKSCAGQYVVRDQDGNKAMVVYLDVKDSVTSYILGSIVSAAALLCACCVKCCCCRKSSSDKKSDGDDRSPAAADNEDSPVRLLGIVKQDEVIINQPTETPEIQYPIQPPHASTDPLIHNPPTELPPPYFTKSTLTDQTDAPTIPLCSDNEPRFEIKGLNFLSDTTSDVYTSDKLNFL